MKAKALAKFLAIEETEIEEIKYETYEAEGCEYMVLTDEEADEKAEKYIKDSLWAFNTDFIIQHSRVLNYDDASRQIIKAIQEQCESGNNAMGKLIDDIDTFIEDAIGADGRGHFINTYDGEENEETIDGETFYIYRTN